MVDIVIVGGGIAGASAAYFLAQADPARSVVLVEAESTLAHHTTGRSAALLIENYGTGPTRPLTKASLEFLRDPPTGLADHDLLTKRGLLTVSTQVADHDELERQLAEGNNSPSTLVEISRDEAMQVAPHIAYGPDHRMLWEPEAADIDVAGLHQAFVRGFRAAGGKIVTSCRVDAARPDGAGWRVDTTTGPLHTDMVVNAAGAWGDVVAASAGVQPVGLTPLRRTALMTASPFADSERYAVVASVRHEWYLRPDGAQFLCSPADETPSEPCDAKPEEIDVARAIDLINANTLLDIRSITSSWAGLRTFAPDRSMVIGPDPDHPGFLWCVGQGGTGIQTAPGAGRLVADLAQDGAAGEHFAGTGLDVAALAPQRFVEASAPPASTRSSRSSD